MDYDENTLGSEPTMVPGGARRPAEPYDEPSLGSAPTMAPAGANGGASSPSEPPIGRIDQYNLVRKLGGGGFGVVYLARDTVSGVEVALKTLHPLLKTNAEEMERLREKFALVARLTHQNIAKALVLHPVRDIAIVDDEARRELRLFTGDFVMVMDYAPGVTLSKWRRQFPGGKVPLDQALEISRQIASALDYAHGEKIVHRDIKPSNVMVETLPPEASRPSRSTANHGLRVRILDFGLAAEIRSSMSRVSTETGDTSGTRPYMAPEQWLGKKQDGRTDQYALACVLYELLAGEPPFAGVFETGDPIIMRTAVERDAPEEIEGVPPAVNAALQNALAKDPKERFASCAEFVEAVSQKKDLSHTEALRHGDSNTGGTPPPATSAAPSWERGHPARGTSAAPKRRSLWPWLLAGAAVVVLVVGLWRTGGTSGTGVTGGEFDMPDPSSGGPTAVAATPSAPTVPLPVPQEERRGPKPSARAGERKVVRVGAQEVALRWCPATTSAEWKHISGGKDTFTMGSPASESGHVFNEVQHEVQLTHGFWMGETEVTQGLWKEVMGSNPSDNKSGDEYPVEQVSWENCQEFIAKLNVHPDVKKAGFRFGLPTEAQWEYACRAGTTGDYGGTGHLNEMGWYHGNSGGKTHPVGQKEPNAWNLRDMHGNVWECCQDWYDRYPTGAVTDPTGPVSGNVRILRGGCFWNATMYGRSAFRFKTSPDFCLRSTGLRLVAFQGGR